MGRFDQKEKIASSTSLINANNQPFFGPDPKKAGSGLSVLGVPAPEMHRTPFGVSATLYFAKDTSLLDTANFNAVQQLATELKLMPDATVTVDGHASNEGKAERNQQLSESRRNTVILFLKDLKSAKQPTFGGQAFGSSKPAEAETGATDAEIETKRRLNRRVEVHILFPPGMIQKPDEKKDKPPVFQRPDFRGPLPPEIIEKMQKEWEQKEQQRKWTQVIPPVQTPKQSLNDLVWGKVEEVAKKALKGIGIKGKANEFLAGQLAGALKSGGEKAVDAILDAQGIQGQERAAIKAAMEAAAKTPIIPK